MCLLDSRCCAEPVDALADENGRGTVEIEGEGEAAAAGATTAAAPVLTNSPAEEGCETKVSGGPRCCAELVYEELGIRCCKDADQPSPAVPAVEGEGRESRGLARGALPGEGGRWGDLAGIEEAAGRRLDGSASISATAGPIGVGVAARVEGGPAQAARNSVGAVAWCCSTWVGDKVA